MKQITNRSPLLTSRKLLFFFLLCLSCRVYGQQMWTYTYDTDGNRTAVAFSTSCAQRMAQSPELDSVIKAEKYTSVSEPSLFPNPAYQYFVAAIPSNYLGGKLMVFNDIGEQVLAPLNLIAEQHIVDVSMLSAGIYFVQITDVENHIYTKSFIKN